MPEDREHADRVRRAGLHLSELLRTRYRHVWHRTALMDRDRGNPVHQGAVAKVLADHLQGNPRERRPGDRSVLPASLATTVSRALDGKQLGPAILEAFIGAFAMEHAHARQLRSMLAGVVDPEVVVGDLPPPADMAGFRDREYDTLMLFEQHRLGPDGLPVGHRTLITVRARVDGLSNYQYRIDTPHAEVSADGGGDAGELVALGGGIWAVDLAFAPLRARETHHLEFRTELRYDEPPATELRRGTHELVENLTLQVHFDPARRPSAVRFASWAHYRPPLDVVVASEPVDLRADLSAHRYLAVVERAVVGFSWQW